MQPLHRHSSCFYLKMANFHSACDTDSLGRREQLQLHQLHPEAQILTSPLSGEKKDILFILFNAIGGSAFLKGTP